MITMTSSLCWGSIGTRLGVFHSGGARFRVNGDWRLGWGTVVVSFSWYEGYCWFEAFLTLMTVIAPVKGEDGE